MEGGKERWKERVREGLGTIGIVPSFPAGECLKERDKNRIENSWSASYL